MRARRAPRHTWSAPPAGTHGADEALLEEIRRCLVQELQPERVYLFGSRARGDAHKDSDYDLLIVVREYVGEPLEMERRARRAVWDVDAAFDLVVMTTDYFTWMLDAAASLPATVVREGRLLYAA